MAVTRQNQFNDGTVLTESALEGEFDRIYGNGTDIAFPLTKTVSAGGFDIEDIDELEFDNASANASAAGRLRRNSANLTWHDGTAAGRLFYAGGTDVPVGDGGTGLSSGTSGGILAFTGATTLASSAALTANGVVLGGGAGAAPTSTAAGTANQVLRVPSAGGAPAFGSDQVTLSSPTLTTPTIAATGWTNATHAHTAASSGGTLSHNSATDNPSANVHGLGASVNVLGNRSAAGEFIQRGTFNPNSVGTSASTDVFVGAALTVSFAVTFATAAYVPYAGLGDTDIGQLGSVSSITTSSFSIRMWGVNSGQDTTDGRFIALGD